MGFLPPAFSASEFWRDIPPVVVMMENGLRAVVFALPFFMPLNAAAVSQRVGLSLYVGGTCLYFLSWLALILAPDSLWSSSLLGFLAPAYTPLLWFTGIALLGRELFWGRFYRWWMYWVLSVLFVSAHVFQAFLVYVRNY